MTADTPDDFDRRYLETWTEPDPQRRRANIERMWSADGRMVVSSPGPTVRGVADIAAHIGRVHEENIVGHGLRFAYDQHVEADDALLLRWSMSAAGGAVVGRGVDLVFRDAEGLVETVYMFTGVD
jgi:SnoaL-like protein